MVVVGCAPVCAWEVRDGPERAPPAALSAVVLVSMPRATAPPLPAHTPVPTPGATEFENLAVRDEELPELDTLVREVCPYEVKGGGDNKRGKANVLLQVGGRVGQGGG